MKLALICAALLLMGGLAFAQMFPCAIAINHCWTGRETTQTINQLFHEPGPRPVKVNSIPKKQQFTDSDDPFLQWLAEVNAIQHGDAPGSVN